MKTVIEMALSVVPETDREDAQGYELLRLTYSELERFAELFRADEREACEEICVANGALGLAAAIRARGKA